MNSLKQRELIINSLKKSGYSKLERNVYHHLDSHYNDSLYVDNFGFQWNIFQKTQFDSQTLLPLTESRLKQCSEWDLDKLSGKLVLELGSGAGRFTEIFLKYGAIVVSLELSSAIYSNAENNRNENLFALRESLIEFELKDLLFDYVFCYGVAQHLPNPEEAYYKSCKYIKPNTGKLTIDHYLRRLDENIPLSIFFINKVISPLSLLILEMEKHLDI